MTEKCAFHRADKTFVELSDLRQAVVDEAIAEETHWFDAVKKAHQKEDDDPQFGHLVKYWLGGIDSTIPPGKVEPLQNAAIDPTIVYGNVTDSVLTAAVVNFNVLDDVVEKKAKDVYDTSRIVDVAVAALAMAKKNESDSAKAVAAARKKVADAQKSGTQAVIDQEKKTLESEKTVHGWAVVALSGTQATYLLANGSLKDAKKAHDQAVADRDAVKKPAEKWDPADLTKVQGDLLTKASVTASAAIKRKIGEALQAAHNSRADTEAWSAAFISSTIRSVGLKQKLQTALLTVSRKHWKYVQDALTSKTGRYRALAPRLHPVEAGDLIATDRKEFIPKPIPLTSSALDGRILHVDIVVDFGVSNGTKFAETIGGNVGHTVRRRRYPLDADGKLIVDRKKDYVTQADDGTFPTFASLPETSMLDPTSTFRIIALLQPIKECKNVNEPGKSELEEGFPMSRFQWFAGESPFLESDVLTSEEVEPRYELLGIESPFLTAELERSFAELEEAGSEEAEEPAPVASEGLIAFDAQTLPIRVAVLVTQAARQAREVDVLLFAHGLDVCKPVLKNRPVTFITERPFRLGQLVEASGRPIVLVVPFLDWEHMAKNKLSFGHKWHKLAQPKNFNGVIAEAMEKVAGVTGTAPSIGSLIVAGHSRAFGIFDALAKLHTDPEMAAGALAKLTDVWALDSTYTSPVDDWMKWLESRSDLRMTVIYRYGTYRSEKTNSRESLSTGVHGARFRARAKGSGGRMTVIPVPMEKVGHCAIPGRYLPELLSSPPGSAAAPATREELFYLDQELYADDEKLDTEEYVEAEEQEGEDFEEGGDEEPSAESFAALAEEESEEEEGERDYELEEGEESYDSFETETEADDEESEDEEFVEEEVLESSGLTPAELKAVQITSTFETGKRGGFYGLSGNFDGYGLSFGLVNWNIGTGSLQPLLRDFAAEQAARWNEIFGPHAASFLALITPNGNEAVKKQLRFAIDEMNTSRMVKGKKKWAIKEPWITYFKQLSEDTAFQAIQVRYVRDLLARARYFCDYFGLKSEMSFAFMFDAVSSHGKGWLTKKYEGNVEKRRELLRPRLAALETMYGKGKVPERDVLLAIADILAVTSSERWRDNVRRRKQWFVTGQHPRAAELKGLQPRPDVPYAASKTASTSASPAPSAAPKPATVAHTPAISGADRSKAIADAIHQAKTAGEAEARVAIVKTIEANGENLESWFEGLVPDASFLGRRIRASDGKVAGVHRALLERLQRAERTLLDQYPGRTLEQLGQELGVYDVAGLRIPKKPTGKNKGVSYHCFGLAVDINHDTNPFVGNDWPKHDSPRYKELLDNRSPRVIERAMLLLRSEKLDLDHEITATIGALWDVHHRASEALAEYLRLADDIDGARLQSLVAKAQAGGDSRTLAWWKNRITTDRAVLPHWDFRHVKHPEKTGYMDLPRDLVRALLGAGLYWGGQYQGSKDIMHFDLRSGPIKQRKK